MQLPWQKRTAGNQLAGLSLLFVAVQLQVEGMHSMSEF
jgi:hypothetical protein